MANDFPLRGDALIGAIYRLALYSRKHRGYNLATFTDNILRPVGDNRFRVVLHQKTMEIRALAVWQELAPYNSGTTVKYYVSEFIARDRQSSIDLAEDVRAYLFNHRTVYGVSTFLEAAGETRSVAPFASA